MIITEQKVSLEFTLCVRRCWKCGKLFSLEKDANATNYCSPCFEGWNREKDLRIGKLENQIRGYKNYIKGLKK